MISLLRFALVNYVFGEFNHNYLINLDHRERNSSTEFIMNLAGMHVSLLAGAACRDCSLP